MTTKTKSVLGDCAYAIEKDGPDAYLVYKILRIGR